MVTVSQEEIIGTKITVFYLTLFFVFCFPPLLNEALAHTNARTHTLLRTHTLTQARAHSFATHLSDSLAQKASRIDILKELLKYLISLFFIILNPAISLLIRMSE